MSTRTNIVVTGQFGDKLWFYRHSDGYPEGAMPTLQKFINWVRQGRIRNNTEQASGWLILIGAKEYGTNWRDGKGVPKKHLFEPDDENGASGWKCGAYEPAVGVHGDIEYLYIVNLSDQTISCYENWDKDGNPKGEPLFVDTKDNPWKAEPHND